MFWGVHTVASGNKSPDYEFSEYICTLSHPIKWSVGNWLSSKLRGKPVNIFKVKYELRPPTSGRKGVFSLVCHYNHTHCGGGNAIIHPWSDIIIRWWHKSLHHHYNVTRSYFQHTVGTKIFIPETSLNTQGLSSVRFPTQYMTCLWRCSKVQVSLILQIFATMNYVNLYLFFTQQTSSHYNKQLMFINLATFTWKEIGISFLIYKFSSYKQFSWIYIHTHTDR